jgi:hypothetical protein
MWAGGKRTVIAAAEHFAVSALLSGNSRLSGLSGFLQPLAINLAKFVAGQF